MRNLLRSLGFLLVIPIIGYAISSWILGDIAKNNTAAGVPPMAQICVNPEVLKIAEINAACGEYKGIVLLQEVSLWTGLSALVLPLIVFLGSRIAGTHRDRLASVFRPLLLLVVGTLSIMVLVDAGILAYAAYIGESYAIERVHFVIIGLIGLGGLVAAVKLGQVAISFAKPAESTVIGKELAREAAPKLFSLLDDVAQKLGARVPDNVVMGLDPTFFATSAHVRLLGETRVLEGQTLFLSAPLSRLLTVEELTAVIGHELGHFRGADTMYSLKFAPVYSGLRGAIAATSVGDDEGASGLAKLPALAFLSYVYQVFAEAESQISREREIAADSAGAAASSGRSLTTALCKVAIYSDLWPHVQGLSLKRLSRGQVTRNLSSAFADSARFDVEAASLEENLGKALEHRISHPTDSHPPISERMTALNVKKEDILLRDLEVPSEPALRLFGECFEAEQELSMLEHRFQVAIGRVVVPEGAEPNPVGRAIYMLVACLIRADGSIDPREVLVAEGTAARLLGDEFDPLEFRQVCSHPDEIGDPDEVVAWLRGALKPEGREMVIALLRDIANADGQISREEQDLLSRLEKALRESGDATPV